MKHRIEARASRGFTLIELMVVVIVMSAIAGISIMWWQATQRHAIRESLIAQQSEQMAMINRAAYEFVRGNDWTATGTDTTQPFGITMTELATAGTLPWQIPDLTPLGQSIRIRARTVDDKWYVVVYAVGEPAHGRTAAAGMPPTSEAVRSFSASVMRRLRDTHLTSAGVITWGETADLMLSGFVSDFQRLIDGPAAWPTTVAMAGFSQFAVVPPVEFEGEIGGGGAAKCPVPRSHVLDSPGVFYDWLSVREGNNIPSAFTVRLVGGGGGGSSGGMGPGSAGGAGGGSGADITLTSNRLSLGHMSTIVVGAGGNPGQNGEDTIIGSVRAGGGRRAAGSLGGAAGGPGGFAGHSGGGYTGSVSNGRGPNGAGGGPGGGGGWGADGAPGSGGGGAGGAASGGYGGSGRIEFHWNEWVDC